jgi:endonuclease/exonuclease/phosphatase family metal-dependent hydrolase
MSHDPDGTQQQQGAPPSSLRVVTQNCWGHFMTFAPNKQHRVGQFMKKLRDDYSKALPDLILLQELYALNVAGLYKVDEVRDEAIREAQSSFGINHCIFGRKPIFGQDAGVVLLSRFDVLESEERAWRPWHDFGTGKGFIFAKMRLPGADTVLAITAHLDAHRAEDRREQLESIAEIIEKHKDLPIILAGDFNIERSSREFENVRRALPSLRSVFEGWEGWQNGLGTFRANDALIDYMFVSGHWEWSERRLLDLRDDEGEPVSDHRGLSAVLTLKQQRQRQ